ncbi:MAG: PAS domain S-box protein [Aliarcobacter sp.]|nr:PAS domain S-box protein [Aliarcobacter sp.]
MYSPKKSLYLILSPIIILTVILVISINSTISYITTKNQIINDIKNDSNRMIVELRNNIKNLMYSYSVNEYEKLLHNEMESNEILFAIVVKDYNLGKLLGKEYEIRGKTRDENFNIIDFDYENETHKKLISQAYYEKHFDITNEESKKIGTISLYLSDRTLNKELDKIISNNVKEALIISLILILLLFLTIRYFVLKPLNDMIEVINNADKDGIPTEKFSSSGSKEIFTLSNTMNNMIESIKSSRKILKDNENRLKSLLEMSPIAVRIATNEGEKIVFANNAYLKLLNIEAKELLQKNPKIYYIKESIYRDILDSLDRNERIENKLISLNIDNNEVWVIASYMNIIYDNEKAVIGWFYDVTDKIKIQKQIEEQKNEFETIFNYSIDGLAIVDLESNFLEFNASYIKMTGFTREELLKTSCINLTAPEDIPRAKIALENILNKGFVVDFEKTCIVKDNRHLTVNMSMVLLPDKKRILLSIKDITQHKLMESQSKLASMGEMIGNIAHQWRQPLSLISTIASGIKVKVDFGLFDEKEIIPDMENIIKQTNYLSNTIDDFRNFIKNSNEKGEVQISNIINKTLSILNPSIVNHNIKMILNIKDDIKFDGYENQLIQALINILNNAKDALEENVKADKNKLIFIETKNIPNGLVLKIKDNAGGIPENIIGKIFEPYFTTKHKSIGTGIGLSMTHQIIIKHHNANIFASTETYEYENKTYTGACFTIIFNKNK